MSIQCINDPVLVSYLMKQSLNAQKRDLVFVDPPVAFLRRFEDPTHLPYVIILGKSGAGKGTIAKALVRKFPDRFSHLSIGDIHRRENQRGTQLGLKIRSLIQRGQFFSPEMRDITIPLVFRALSRLLSADKYFLLDNFPTSRIYLPFMDVLLERFRLKNVLLVVPVITDEESLERLKGRKICSNPACGESFHATLKLPKIHLKCDYCGSDLTQRMDDTTEQISQKSRIFKEHINPVIAALSSNPRVTPFCMRNMSALLEYLPGE